MRAAISRTLDRLQESCPALCGFMNWSPVGMEPFHDVVREELAPRRGLRVLDFGCGRGAISDLFDGACYLGIDVSASLVGYARQRHPSHRYAVMDGTRLALDDASFDAAVIVGVLHHLDDAATAAALQELRRVLAPGGRLLVMEPVPVLSPWNLPGKVIKSLDVGNHIRPDAAWRELMSRAFTLTRAYHRRIGFNDLSILLGTRTHGSGWQGDG